MDMNYRGEPEFSSGNAVQIISGNSPNGGVKENWEPEWATEDDYGIWNNNNNEASRSENEPPNKRSKNSQSGDPITSNRSKAIGKMFYKTKLCCKFRVGTCPYITNCNFAHSIEELRNPPPNWQEIMAAHGEDRGPSSEMREEFQIPIIGVFDETQRSYKGKHCKKFYTEEGCPYGENCTFFHDEQSKARESVAISLGPGGGGGGGVYVNNNNNNYNNNSSVNNNNNSNNNINNNGNANVSTLKPSNWKTRICNKWELTGYCPFGSKCHFAHGAAELHEYGGGPLDLDINDSSTSDAKQGAIPSAKTLIDAVVASHPSLPYSDSYHLGVPSQRLSSANQKTGTRAAQKWKGPDKISKIYGDWIDDL